MNIFSIQIVIKRFVAWLKLKVNLIFMFRMCLQFCKQRIAMQAHGLVEVNIAVLTYLESQRF